MGIKNIQQGRMNKDHYEFGQLETDLWNRILPDDILLIVDI